MRLLFLCSCLEPGRDGVGDHVRLLAEACARQGAEVALLAANDPFIPAQDESIGGSIPTLRLSAAMPWPERVERIALFRAAVRPDWISLHLVSYGFQPRGLLGKLADIFREMAGDTPVQLMFHELWLGGGEPTPLRHKLAGFFQRRGILQLVDRLRPRLITTSNPVYAAMLRAHGIEAFLLPLFGNVPIFQNSPINIAMGLKNREQWWIGVFFGGLPAEWQPEPFFRLLLEAAANTQKKVCLVLIGRAGWAGEALWREMESTYGSQIKFVSLGEVTVEMISACLRDADFGVAASPWQLIGKSGSAAAMLDHGLPVIVTRDDFQPYLPGDRPPPTDPLVHRLDDALPGKLAAGLPKRPARHRVDEIAAQLLALLKSAAAP
jgi:glycosyltransferase involved in cell wall biosynthesis